MMVMGMEVFEGRVLLRAPYFWLASGGRRDYHSQHPYGWRLLSAPVPRPAMMSLSTTKSQVLTRSKVRQRQQQGNKATTRQQQRNNKAEATRQQQGNNKAEATRQQQGNNKAEATTRQQQGRGNNKATTRQIIPSTTD